jgi:hypothetical protein
MNAGPPHVVQNQRIIKLDNTSRYAGTGKHRTVFSRIKRLANRRLDRMDDRYA